MSATTFVGMNPLNMSIMHLLHRSGQYATEVFAETAGEDGLTPRQYAVLITVQGNEGLSQTDLVSMTGIDRSTLADVVRRLLKKGLLQRRRTRQDQRAYAVRLTENGQALLDAYRPKAAEADERLLHSVPPEERDCFMAALRTLVSAVEREQDTASP